MKRRQLLAAVGGVGVTSVAGCVGLGGGGSGGGSCSPPSETDLDAMLPEETDSLTGQFSASSGVSSLGTDDYVVGRYRDAEGRNSDLLIARYESSDAAQADASTAVGLGEFPATGSVVTGRYVVVADAQSEDLARELVSASAFGDGCADALSFESSSGGGSGDGDATDTDTDTSDGGSDDGASGDVASCPAPSGQDTDMILPRETDSLTLQSTPSVSLSLRTDAYRIFRYQDTEGELNDVLVAQYPSSEGARADVGRALSEGTAVTGYVVAENVLVVVDVQDEALGRELVAASAFGDACADALSFEPPE